MMAHTICYIIFWVLQVYLGIRLGRDIVRWWKRRRFRKNGFQKGDKISIAGSADNDGEHFITKAKKNTLTLSGEKPRSWRFWRKRKDQ